jgi:tetratricopeptide (TPR) repeat protein
VKAAGTLYKTRGRRQRWSALSLAILVFVTPCAILFATSPGDANDGFVHIPGPGVRVLMVVLCLVLGALLLANILCKFTDHELVFGAFTVFTALTSMVALLSVFARRHVEDQAGRMLLLLAGLAVLLLVLATYDWGRRQLMIAAAVAAVALSLFIVRVGFESLKVPPRWERVQIVAQTQADEDALTLQHDENITALRTTAMAAQKALNDIVNGLPALNVDDKLSQQANLILHRSNLVIQRGETEDANDFSKFDALVANEDPAKVPPAAANRLADAVHALQAAETALAAPASFTALDQAICAINPPESRECSDGRVWAITDNGRWVTAKHALDVQLATYRAEVTGTQADQSALQAVLAQQPNADEDISVLSAIQNGPQTLWRSAFHASGPALDLGPLGWAVLGALLLGLLSLLLKENARQLSGPVSVTPLSSTAKNGDKLTAELRVAVLMNVAEPGAAPGSPSTNPVTTLLDIAVGATTAISKIAQAVLAIVGQRYGYQVAIDVTTGDLADSSLVTGGAGTDVTKPATATTVLVRVMSVTSGATYASHLCSSPDEIEAVRVAGLWAAGYVLNRSSRIPHWAAWEAETAHALVTAKNKVEHNIPALKAALADAPNSGILLVLLGHRYELAGKPLEAIECYARAVTAYPRYPVARYRLAVALAAMRHDEFDWLRRGPRADYEDSMLRAVQAAVEKLRVNDEGAIKDLLEEGDQGKAEQDRVIFKKLACKLLNTLRHDTWKIYLLVDALRRSERITVWPALIPMSKHPAHRFPVLVRSARRALSGARSGCLYRKAGKDGMWWQISYNAACRRAADIATVSLLTEKHNAADGALKFLEQTLVRPGVEQLSADWVSRDPDLAVLRALPRFKRFLAQLKPGE